MSVLPNAMLMQYESVLLDVQKEISNAQTSQATALLIAAGAVLLFASSFLIPSIRRAVPAWYPPLALPVAAFSGWKYLRHRRTAFIKSRLADFYRRGVQRLNGTWAGTGESGAEFRTEGHLYDRDLHVLGNGSLFELLCTARTQLGKAKLAAYLLELPLAPESCARQEAVKELAPNRRLRETVHLLGQYQFEGADWRAITDWLNDPPVQSSLLLRILMAVNSILLGCLILSVFVGAVSVSASLNACIALAATQLLFAALSVRRTRPALERVRRFASDIAILRKGLEVLQSQTFNSGKLRSLAGVANPSAVVAARRLERLVNAVYDCDKEWFYAPSRLLLVRVQLAFAIDQWKSRHGLDLKQWTEAWAEFEALNALGCYAYEHPGDVFPTLSTTGAFLQATGLAHPLLREETSVRNNVDLGPQRRFYLISGSNMAGKSTLLRAIGTNAVLAAAGAPVRAHSAQLSAFSICASITTTDALLEGKSRFLAEVERLRETVRSLKGDKPVLFLFDEIFSGTNSTDRRIAAEAVVRELIEGGAVGVISTHDLALTQIAAQPELAGENIHLASDGSGDPLAFDYLVKPGICTESSAVAILNLAGIRPAVP